MRIVYFSSTSENTHRFVQKLGHPSSRIPLRAGDASLEVSEPYVLVLPTYGAGRDSGAVPKQVIKFLNDERNRSFIRGVVSGGNTNFGAGFCLAGDIVSRKCQVPVLHRFEVLGTSDDVSLVQTEIEKLEKE